MRIANENMIPSGAVDLATSSNLAAVWLGHICNFSIQLVFTGSPVGTFKLQCSDDAGRANGGEAQPQSSGVTHWTDIAGSSTGISAAGNIVYNIQNAGYSWVRVAYTAASGTGSLSSARINVKGV